MLRKLTRAAVVAALLVPAAGCGDDKKADIPKDLNKELPPPPVSSGGGGGKAGKKGTPAPAGEGGQPAGGNNNSAAQ